MRSLLYVTPVVPDVTGNGLAMRAGTVLRLLAARYDVSLLAVALHGPVAQEVPPDLERLCVRSAVLPLDPHRRVSPLIAAAGLQWPPARIDRDALPAVPAFDAAFDVIHLYRLTTLPYAFPYLLHGNIERHLDIDESESASRRRLATLYRRTGRATAARFLDLEASLSERVERDILSRFDRVYACSAAERDALPDHPARSAVRVLPNVLPPPPTPAHDEPAATSFTLLFVGTLAFAPNDDAVRFLCGDIVPRLRRLAPRPFRVAIVGPGASDDLRRVADIPEVSLAGAVPSLEPWYAAAGAVVVPLRSGGGTRLKVLEAMRFGRAIVTTPEGIAGLDARAGEHVLVGDSADALAESCARLMADDELRNRIRARAHHLFLERYTPDAVAGVLA